MKLKQINVNGKVILQHEFEEYIYVVEKYPDSNEPRYFSYLKEMPEIQAVGDTKKIVRQKTRDLYHLLLGRSLTQGEQLIHPITFMTHHDMEKIKKHTETCEYCRDFFQKKI